MGAECRTSQLLACATPHISLVRIRARLWRGSVLTVSRFINLTTHVTPQPEPISPIAGSVLPLQKAEELLATLHEVVSARIVADSTGNVEAIHVLVTGDLTPKQMVRNVESALMAQLGMRVDHRKISVATTVKRPDAPPMPHAPVYQTAMPFGQPQAAPVSQPQQAPVMQPVPQASVPLVAQPQPAPQQSAPSVASRAGYGAPQPNYLTAPSRAAQEPVAMSTPSGSVVAVVGESRRELYFEDVEIRGSRTKGMVCKVTLRRGAETIVGEAEGSETEKSRVDLSARATLAAIGMVDGASRRMTLEGARVVQAFDREVVMVGVLVRTGRASTLLMGSCEIRDSAETASALAVLNATNRWIEGVR